MGKRGRFITVEGIEGAGKSTCMEVIAESIQARNIDLVITREPGGTELGERIRSLLLGHEHHAMGDDTELLLMFAARSQHLGEKILPALEKGKWVLSDRFTDASYAYQGGGRQLSRERIAKLEEWVQKGLKPDMTILMDLPVEVGLDRAFKRSEPDRFEIEKKAFFERVRQCYLEIAKADPQRFSIINSNQSLELVKSDIQKAVLKFIDAKSQQ